jgi:hypothetical protein
MQRNNLHTKEKGGYHPPPPPSTVNNSRNGMLRRTTNNNKMCLDLHYDDEGIIQHECDQTLSRVEHRSNASIRLQMNQTTTKQQELDDEQSATLTSTSPSVEGQPYSTTAFSSVKRRRDSSVFLCCVTAK